MGFIHSSSQPCASSTPKIVQAISKIENISPLLFTREGSEQCEKWLKELSVNKAQTHFLAHSIFKKYEVEYAPFGIILDHKRRVVWLGNPQILTKAKIEKIINNFDRFDSYLNGKIAWDIEEHRKGQFVINFKDTNGESLSDVHVRVKQKKHACRFGCSAFYLDQFEDEQRRRLYREHFKNLFNYAVVPFYWDTLEPEQGKPRFQSDSRFVSRRPPIDTIIQFCEENKIRAKGHCLVYNSFQPQWISDDNEVLKRQITKRIGEIAKKYEDRIFDFDVINEMITVYKNAYVGNGARNLQITDEPDHEKWAFDTCRRYFPNANLYWNEGMFETFGTHYKGFRSFYYLMIEKMLREGVRIDGLGMQYHAYAPKETADVKLAEVCNPLRIIDVLER